MRIVDPVIGAQYRLEGARSLSLADGTDRVELLSGTPLIVRSMQDVSDHGFGSESSGRITIVVFEVAGGPQRGVEVEVIYRAWLPSWLARS